MFDRIQTYVIVTLIAVLIWLYAEGQTVKVYDNELIRVRFVSGDGERGIVERVDSPNTNEVRIEATIRASTAGKASLNELTKNPIELNVTFDAAKLEQTINIQSLLENHDAFLQTGVNLLRISPEEVRLRVEQIDEVKLPVVINTDGIGLDPGTTPTTELGEVTVKVRTSDVLKLKGRKVQARLDRVDVSSLNPNQQHQLNVDLTLPDDLEIEDVTLQPSATAVTFKLRQQPVEHTLSAVRIVVVAPPLLMDQYSIELAPENSFLSNVELRGTPSAIGQIIEEARKPDAESNLNTMVYAELRFLRSTDLQEGEQRVLPVLYAPAGIQLKNPLERVKIFVKRRTSTTEPSPPPLPPTDAELP